MVITAVIAALLSAVGSNAQLADAAVEQTGYTTRYDPRYVRLTYPGGDVPLDRGVCSDVVIRALRKVGVDLQKEVHEDMAEHFDAYPHLWGSKLDRSIDHRRVANLMAYFQRQEKSLAISDRPRDYAAGDIVAWDLGGGVLHIGVVAPRNSIVHNIGAGAKLEAKLFAWRVIGHYRYF